MVMKVHQTYGGVSKVYKCAKKIKNISEAVINNM